MTRTMQLYIQALEGWPVTLADAARPIIRRHAQQAYDDVKAGYGPHRVTGTLEAGLTLKDTDKGPLHPSMTLENDVYYAKIFEAGGMTTAGPKPAGRVFIPITVRERRAMRGEIFDLIDRTAPRG
jgi:hypothetical protein